MRYAKRGESAEKVSCGRLLVVRGSAVPAIAAVKRRFRKKVDTARGRFAHARGGVGQKQPWDANAKLAA